jgi:SAM-dependent methyltransferase
MTTPVGQHAVEIERNADAWRRKPLLRRLYGGFYDRILALVDPAVPGPLVEIGSGIGNLKARVPQAVATDLFPNPWLDVVCDGYRLPFGSGHVSHLILFDVFHHLQTPAAFLREARRVLAPRGRVILFDPYISMTSFPVYAWLHHEPVAWRSPIDPRETPVPNGGYYAAQGNATRVFFAREPAAWLTGWRCLHASASAEFSYLLSGGFSRAAWYSDRHLDPLRRWDARLSRWPRLFGARCLVALTPA